MDIKIGEITITFSETQGLFLEKMLQDIEREIKELDFTAHCLECRDFI